MALALVSALPIVGAQALLAAAPGVAGPIAPVVTDISANSVGSGQLFGGRVEALAVNPGSPSVVFAAVEFGGLWRSSDQGNTWSHVDGLPLTSMDDVKVAAADPGLVVATGQYDRVSTTRTAETYVSTDGGATWTRAAAAGCPGNSPRSSHKIAFGPGAAGSVPIFVATDCGLIHSTDSGNTWTDVTPNGVNNQFWDLKITGAAPNFTVDTCGSSGFFRSTNGGTSFTQNSGALASGFLPCRIATAPGNSNVVFLSDMINHPTVAGLCEGQLQESDDGGTSFTNLKPTGDANCRPANVITAPGFTGSTPTQFELFFATDSHWIHQRCDLSRLPSTTCTVGSSNNAGSFADYDGNIPHNAPDSADLAFGANGCPFLAAGDGGVFRTSNGCTLPQPAFTASNKGLHGLQATATAGTSYTGHADLYFGTQDNGIWNSGDGGVSWAQQGPDVYGVYADQDGPPSQVLYKECCNISGGIVSGSLLTNNEGMTSQATLNLPPGVLPPFGNILGAQFGYQSYALATNTTGSNSTGTWRIYVTTNSGGTWNQMGPDLPANSKPSQLLASGPAATPTFFLLNKVGTAAPVLSRLSGALGSTSATLTAVGGGLGNPRLVGVNPNNPLLLWAEDDSGLGALKHSIDGGATFTTDNTLTGLIQAGGAYVVPGSVTAFGVDGNSNTVLVATVDEGIFASTDAGAHWAAVPGSTQISRATGFFFDEKTGIAYTASAGRAMWKIALPHADLAITKTHSPVRPIAGKELIWHLTVTNNGPDAASGAVVTDTLPAGDSYLANTLNPPAGCTAAGQTVTCTVGDLAAGASVSFDIVTLVDPNLDASAVPPGPTAITNQATVSSPLVIDPDLSNNTVEDTAVVNDSADLAVTKICKPDTTVHAGNAINCTVFVDNHGPSAARNVVMDDTTLSDNPFTISNVTTVPANLPCTTGPVTGGQQLSCQLGNLAPASTTTSGRDTISYTLTANNAQDIDNLATVRSDTPDPNPNNNHAKASLTVTAVADLSLTKSGPASVVAGAPITWTLTAHNAGPSPATNTVIKDTVPAGVTITSVTMPGASCTAGVPGDPARPTTCQLGTLAAGADSATMTITATVNPGTTGVLHNDASVDSATFDPNTSNNLAHSDTTVTVVNNLTVTKTASPDPVVAGGRLDYQITVTNNGPSTATGVNLTDPIPAQEHLVSAAGQTPGISCRLAPGPTTVQCALPDLDPGKSATVGIRVTVDPATPDGSTITDTATATANGGNTANGSATSHVVARADLDVKVDSERPEYFRGAHGEYHLVVRNLGPSDAQSVLVTVAVPAHDLRFESVERLPSTSCAANFVGSETTFTCNLGTIRAGREVAFDIRFRVKDDAAHEVPATARVTATTTDPHPANNTARDELEIDRT